MSKFIKGLYVIWGDEEYINKSLDAGINTLLFSYQNHLDRAENKYYHSAHRTVELITDVTKPCTKLLNPHWFRHWDKISDDYAFTSKIGHKFNSTPCIANPEYVMTYLHNICATAKSFGMQGVIFDFEEYDRFNIDSGVIDIFTGRQPCYCEYCRSQGIAGKFDRQFDRFVDHARTVFESYDLLYGQMPYKEDLNRIFPEDNWWFSEDGYGGFKSFETFRDRLFNFSGFDNYASGIWAEKFSKPALLTEIEKVGTSPLVDGYWIFNAACFSKYSPMHLSTISDYDKEQFTYKELVDISFPHFFEALEAYNRGIDKARDSWWFKLKRGLLLR